MKIPFGVISITDKSRIHISKVIASGKVSSGKYVREFEKKFAKLLDVKEAVAVASGTDADIIALAALYDLGAQRGDEIILPALSFVATGNAVLHAGFKPIFVDIEKETLNINPALIEKSITAKTRAVMPVHLMGKPAAMYEIMKIAKKYKLFVISDAAEAHGSVYRGRLVGTWGDMSAYSLYLAHAITTVEGGIIATNDKRLAGILRSLRCHGRACKCNVCIINTSSKYCAKRFKNGKDMRFISERIGYSSKMNELEAAIGLGSLAIYHDIMKKRYHNWASMVKRLEEFDEFLFTIQEARDEKIGPHAFPVIVREKAPFTRDALTSHLNKNQIDTRDLFCSMPTQCIGFAYLGYKLGEFPNAEYIGSHGFHIGVHQNIKNKHIDYIFSVIKSFIDTRLKKG